MKKFSDIAIIGTSVRFPMAESLDDLDRIYSERIDCIRDLDEERIRLNGLDPEEKYSQFGYMNGIDQFDYRFFNISKTEAECIDPQHRIMMELACSAIESAGYSLSSLRGSNTAVIVGAARSEYYRLFDDETGYATNGTLIDTLPGRISYFLDLHGESSVVATACSSSLYALYDACVKMSAGVFDTALVGGVMLYFTVYKEKTKSDDVTTVGLAAEDGRCKAFEDEADGINIGEGAGFVMIKRYEDAVRDNDNILAVIKAYGANQDGGRSNSPSAPSVSAQAELLEKVWRDFEIDPTEIGYYEAHGTGTRIGDPIEISSMTEAFSHFTEKKQFCPVGSLKSNYSHPGSAAGVASVIKGILSLNKRKKYPLRTMKCPNRMIDFKNSSVYPIAEMEEWTDNKRVYAVNSFGVSGTNVHIVMENAPERDISSSISDEYLVTLSTKNKEQLSVYRSKLLEALKEDDGKALGDICYVLNNGRDDYTFRTSAVVHDIEELRNFLRSDETDELKESEAVFLVSGGLINGDVIWQTVILTMLTALSAFFQILSYSAAVSAHPIQSANFSLR